MAYNHAMKNGFSRLEARVERLVEGTFARLFADRLHPREVALQLARAMEDNSAPSASGLPRAPQNYIVHLHPKDAEALLQAEPELAERLGDELIGLARQSGLVLANRPDVIILPDEAVSIHTATVEAAIDQALGSTMSSTPIGQQAVKADAAHGAFLIVDGQRHISLSQPINTIGRRRDNDIVLDDARVSRAHAQIRQRYGRWVLFDLGSSGGTFVNGEPAVECVLRPGDVISLSGVTLIYGEDEASPDAPATGPGHTRPIVP